MRPLADRLRRLERERWSASLQPCSVCGGHPDAKLTFSLCFADDSEADEPEFCPGCGRHQALALSFDDRD